MANNYILSLDDYQQIYRTVYSIIDSQDGNTMRSCYTFNTLASMILQYHYSLKFIIHCGAVIYKISNHGDPLILGDKKNDTLNSSRKAFHCLLSDGKWILDFMSPMFDRMYKSQGQNIQIPPKMFQKKVSDECEDINKLNKEGDYFFSLNETLKNKSNFIKSDAEQERLLIGIKFLLKR